MSSFASELMDATQQALGRLSENTGAELKNPVSIYIYASAADLQGSMIYSQEWTGGVAFTQYGIIAIGIATDAASVAWGKGAIAHELTHLVVYQVTANPYNNLPTWLDEGLAMYSEGALDASFANALYTAQKNNTLISVRSLTSPFSAYADQAVLAYAESYAIVAYLIEQYGRDKMLELLNLFGQGSGYDDALKQVYGFDMDGLNVLWQASLIAVVGKLNLTRRIIFDGSWLRLGSCGFRACSIPAGRKIKVVFIPGGAALDALDINAVDIALYREVSAASFTGFSPD